MFTYWNYAKKELNMSTIMSKRWIGFIFFVGFLFLCVTFFNFGMFGSTKSDNRILSCSQTNQNDAVMYNLKTKIGVSYESSHWFHMAENFMAYESTLHAQNLQSCADRIILNFDTSKNRSSNY
jgi:hypothetical protein